MHIINWMHEHKETTQNHELFLYLINAGLLSPKYIANHGAHNYYLCSKTNQLIHVVHTKDQIKAWLPSRSLSTLQIQILIQQSLDMHSFHWSHNMYFRIKSQSKSLFLHITHWKTPWLLDPMSWEVVNRLLIKFHNNLIIMLHYSLLHHTLFYKQCHIKDQSDLQDHNSRITYRKKVKNPNPKLG